MISKTVIEWIQKWHAVMCCCRVMRLSSGARACACVRASVCVCVCVCENERDGESVYCVRVCVCVYLSVKQAQWLQV